MNTLAPVDAIRQTHGLYTLQEVAAYSKAPLGTLRYWLYGKKGYPPLRSPLISHTEGRFLTFVEFVEAMAIRNLTSNYGVSLQKVREAIRVAEESFDLPYPFSHPLHKTYLVGTDLHIKFDQEEDLTGLTGRDIGQRSWTKCLEHYMRDLEWDNENDTTIYTAYRYYAKESGSVISIRMNPHIYFGAPMVENTGYAAETLWSAALAEGDIPLTAEYYDVGADDVIAACKYCEEEIRLARAAIRLDRPRAGRKGGGRGHS